MSRREQKKKLTGPWRKLHGAVWLIGLAVLAMNNWWWPGILVLVAISAVIEAVLMKFVPDAFESEEPAGAPPAVPAEPPAVPAEPPAAVPLPPAPEHNAGLLPANCPKCGAPIRGHDVKWTGVQSADCPYCGAVLQVAKE